MIGEYLEKYTYSYLLEDALSHVPDTLDKREGSIIYDAIAPACYELANFYMELRQALQQTYASTANGEYLDLRVQEQGITRYAATTYATKKAIFEDSNADPMIVPIGSRFSTISDTNAINYTVSANYLDEDDIVVPGAYVLTCESLGTAGNAYTGSLIPISYISGLATATMQSIINPARDEETDSELLLRYLTAINQKPFGGNVAQYDELLKGISGVGEVQIYPVWDGGGTVKLSVIDAEYNIITNDFISILKEMIDPETYTGEGIGLAPIGHRVTIVTPTELAINVSATLALKSGYTLAGIQPLVEAAIEEYLLERRQTWGVSNDINQYSCSIYISRITYVILSITGVENVSDVTINSAMADLVLTENKTTQQLPILGGVTLNE